MRWRSTFAAATSASDVAEEFGNIPTAKHHDNYDEQNYPVK
jgi:hypothetical protein